PTTLPGMGSTTTPGGRDVVRDGAPLDLTQMLATAKGSVFLERVSVATPKDIRKAKKAIKKAFQVQLDGLGFALVEVLSPCPTNWKMDPVAAYEWTDKEMTKIFPVGVIKDITGYDKD
ncbi:MAG: 2-oxoglutarate oxidoreductase, partial [Proteobacteria bacterium]|nr:2-oxoglutarate oxidoreductase [Pseudomonadota bacterium]